MAKKLSVNWSIPTSDHSLKPALMRFRRYLDTCGLKNNTIKLYLILAESYLKAVETDIPSEDDAKSFYDSLHEKSLSRSTINNYAAAIIKYHRLIDKPVKLHFLRLNNSLPYYFDQSDIIKIFEATKNFKHFCMFNLLFYGALRSGELCNLDVSDYDPERLTLRLRETKNGSDSFALINEDVAKLLNKYLSIKPEIEIDGRHPLFFTDFGNRFDPNQIYKIFLYWKEKAGVTKKGGVHCFSRHSSATLMLEKGCDIRIVKEVLRHRDLNTTLRYAHVSDVTKRKSYEKYLRLDGI